MEEVSKGAVDRCGRPLKIMLVVSGMGAGGAERVAATLVNGWAACGGEVTLVATCSSRSASFYQLSPAVRFVQLVEIVGREGHGPWLLLRRLLALRRLIRGVRPDVVISFLTKVNLAAILAARASGVPVVACEHSNPAADVQVAVVRLARRVIYPLASAVTVLGEDMVAGFSAAVPGIRLLEVVPNPLSPEIDTVAVEFGEPSGRLRLVAMGHLSPHKGFTTLIAAFSELAAAFPDWDLWIWGEGPLRRWLERQVREAGLEGRVILPGVTSAPWEEMTKGRIFVLSSAFEGLPMTLMEAMALGRACVAFDCPSGPRLLTRDGRDGVLVPAGDRAALAEALHGLMADPARCRDLGSRAVRSVRERFSLGAVLSAWDSLFREIGVRS